MANDKRLDWARRLISSGDVVDRPIWFYRIPENDKDPKRFKIFLLAGDTLPAADKYVYLDSDVIMQKHGDWESDECWGAVSEERFKIPHSNAFNCKKGVEEFVKVWEHYEKKYGHIERVNTGCVILPPDKRKAIALRWLSWCNMMESMCEKKMKLRDQPQFPFVMCEFDLPVAPQRFMGIVKREPITDEHILIHASGHPSGNAREQYNDVVRNVLGGYLKEFGTETQDVRWQVFSNLILKHAENPTYPVGIENGIFRGQNAEHMLRTFPGLRMYAIDNRKPMGAEKKHPDAIGKWEAIVQKYADRVIDMRCDSTEAFIDEPVDYVIDDADHRTEAVLENARHFWPMIKKGGLYIVHDIDRNGTYYDRNSVRKAMEELFGNSFETGADYTAWVVKGEQEIG